MDKIFACVKEVFPDADPATITMSTPLGDVPGWDSMNSVNLLMELEAGFGVRLEDEMLTARDRIADIAELLRRKGAQV